VRAGGGGLARWTLWPALLWTALLFVAPLLVMLAISFTEHGSGAFTLENYAGVVTRSDGAFLGALINSIEVTVIVTLLSVPLAYPLAYILAYRTPPRWQRVLLVMLILPFWTSYVIRSYSWLVVLSKNGVINQMLLSVGLLAEPIEFGNSRGATVLGFVHFFVMLLTLTIFANLVQIKDSYRKAAADLGASPRQTFLHITLPLSLPGVAVGAFTTFVLTIGDYITPQILGGGRELLLPQAIMLQIERRADFPMASALSMVLMLVVTAAYLLFARHLKMERV
jgi:spermidine/putrescine transport system permease protein